MVIVVEGNNTVSSLIATLNPFILEGTNNVGFDNVIKRTGVPQLRSKFFDAQFEAFVEAVRTQLIAALKFNIKETIRSNFLIFK